MKKIYLVRRTAFILTIFALGALITGQVPMWVKLGYPTAVMWLLMIYDEALFELREQKRAYTVFRQCKLHEKMKMSKKV
ncbi:hypothetical protein [Enterococcus gallinarum]|uniref:Transmembrane protein n=1 Tax=Enterococcus gallinarum TaxID=1353 RepID=A0A376L4Z7_ENTGA|nr:hypothetical protein [Enterococcus gallinarum]STF08812.1 Uncharacterised protein [Enterococcus gallinarum]